MARRPQSGSCDKIAAYIARVGDGRNIFVGAVRFIQRNDAGGWNPASPIYDAVHTLQGIYRAGGATLEEIVTRLRERICEANPGYEEHLPTVAGALRGEIFHKPEDDMKPKTFQNSDVSGARKNVPDIRVFGNGDTFQLLCKASSEAEGWMKSTKAMEVPGGCVVQVTTQQRNPDGSYAVAEALTFVPGVRIVADVNDGRKLA